MATIITDHKGNVLQLVPGKNEREIPMNDKLTLNGIADRIAAIGNDLADGKNEMDVAEELETLSESVRAQAKAEELETALKEFNK